jgi:hypothetical protein
MRTAKECRKHQSHAVNRDKDNSAKSDFSTFQFHDLYSFAAGSKPRYVTHYNGGVGAAPIGWLRAAKAESAWSAGNNGTAAAARNNCGSESLEFELPPVPRDESAGMGTGSKESRKGLCTLLVTAEEFFEPFFCPFALPCA